ncbi:hypothetical protein ILUMI_21943 [Ignelater luminosus]|uniref:BESS domain-containing protein n=1 Tax=Ignelater luminosus TaxID=2038154 RepID=A0A8K0G337_IGNLU|nr:hypothetical protein ILUMI_21943 [Ignelater luminosus]
MADAVEQDQQKNPELIRLLQSGRKSESEIRPSSSENANSTDSEWSTDETSCLLKLIAEYEYLPQIKSQNDQVYTKLSKLMTISGHKKTNDEIKYYWKLLQQKYNDHKAGKLKQFDYYDQMSGLLDFNSSPHSEPEIIIIKGEELEGNILHSDLENDYNNQEYEHKNGRSIRRNNWTHKETECVVQVLEKYGMPSRTNLRKFCYVIVDYLKQHGFTRSEEQAQVKIKHLRALYNQVIRKTLKEEEFPFFKRIEALMQSHQTQKVKENDETQNYIALDEQSKSDGEDNVNAEFSEQITEEEDPGYKKGRQIWTNKEIKVLLKFIEENGIVTGKQLRKVCNKAVDYLASYSYYRSPTQILIRWKNTKALYWATFRKKSKVPERECSFFYRLHGILNPDDGTYEIKNFEDVTADDDEEANFYQNSNNNVTMENNTDISAFHFNKISHNQSNYTFKRDSFLTLQNNSNSNDNFISLQNISSGKRFQISDMDPLENGGSGKVTPSSPKRSRTESTEQPTLHVGSCSFCSSLDPIDHYCISLAHSIKKLDARKQAKLKIEIQQLMYKAEFDSDF